MHTDDLVSALNPGHGTAQSIAGLGTVWSTEAWLVDDQLGFYGVAAGVGDGPSAPVAAREALDAVSGYIDAWCSEPDGDHDPGRCKNAMRSAFAFAHREVGDLLATEPAFNARGVTLSALWVRGSHTMVGHVGDSAIWRLRGTHLELLTREHTEGRGRPGRRVVTRCLGVGQRAQAEVSVEAARGGDRFFLATSGLAVVSRTRLRAGMLAGRAAVMRLVEAAGPRERTAIWVEHKPLEEPSSRSQRAHS